MNNLQRHDFQELSKSELLIGVDEAGRGCLAGPVMAGACILRNDFFESSEALKLSAKINDSKQLSKDTLSAQFAVIEHFRNQGLLDFEIASGSVEEIETLNILGATRLAMKRALQGLESRAKGWKLPEAATDGPLFKKANRVNILIDGRPLKPFQYIHTGLIKGDGTSLAIAIASIATKVTRDREMCKLAEQHPEYGFDSHKGYGTIAHRTALQQHGTLDIHRKLFLRKVLTPNYR